MLVIEDDQVDRQGVRRLLRRAGLEVELHEAERLEEAVAALAEESFDVVLLDLNLPDGDGLDLLRRLQEAEGAPAPVIVLTGHQEDALIDACLQAGAQDFLIKGEFQADALGRAIRYARERFRLGEALREQTHELHRSNVELERFASAASHDLQEPLRTLRAMGERLESRHREQLGPEGGELLERMLGATERMQVLIADLLDLSRISTARVEPTRLELDPLLREVEADLAQRLADAGPGAELSLEGPFAAVLGVESQLRRLFGNLLGNALKFHAEERPPQVRVRARQVAAGRRDAFQARSPWARLEVSVEDNGIGFPPERALEIFEPFKRLHGRARYPGTGIGLALCKAIVETHGGRIRAEPRADGPGARFVLTLRAAPAGS